MSIKYYESTNKHDYSPGDHIDVYPLIGLANIALKHKNIWLSLNFEIKYLNKNTFIYLYSEDTI